MGYFDQYNPDLLKLIPPDAKTVLEIGCGEGALCEAYRRINPGVTWLGIEKEPSAARIATAKGAKMVGVDIDADDPALAIFSCDRVMADQKVDVLVFGDVLEHLRDPWGSLKRMMAFIAPGAQVLASIPNVQHWTIIRNLLEGKWDYTDSGLLDRTHLRFFTLKSIREMFDAAGLQVFEIVGRDLFNTGFEAWSLDLGPLVTKEMRAYQYVVRAIKPSVATLEDLGHPDWPSIVPCPIPKLHIHAITAEECCARPRIHEPFAMLRTIPGVTTHAHQSLRGAMFPTGDTILILQRDRALTAENYRDMHCWNNTIFIAEVDDLPEAIGMDPMALKAVHAIQCSTKALAEVCRKYNPNVMVFENQIADLPPFGELNDEGVVMVFCGWQNRANDWKSILPAINRVIADIAKPIVDFTVIHDREFYDALATDNKHFFPFTEYKHYRELLSMCDIALLPLEDTPFNRCKSDIKFIECAAEGVAMLCSQTVYRSVAGMGNPDSYIPRAWIYENSQHFEIMFRDLIEQTELRRHIAEKAYAFVRDNRLLSAHYRKRYEWYQSLLTSKQALDRSLLERCPELAPQLSDSLC